LHWVYTPHMREDIWPLAVGTWLTSLIMFSSHIHLAANDKIPLFFMVEWNSTVYKHYIFLIHSSVVGHLGCFCSLVIVNNAVINLGARCLYCNLTYIPSGRYPEWYFWIMWHFYF
jgi:hypothetical protein